MTSPLEIAVYRFLLFLSIVSALKKYWLLPPIPPPPLLVKKFVVELKPEQCESCRNAWWCWKKSFSALPPFPHSLVQMMMTSREKLSFAIRPTRGNFLLFTSPNFSNSLKEKNVKLVAMLLRHKSSTATANFILKICKINILFFLFFCSPQNFFKIKKNVKSIARK